MCNRLYEILVEFRGSAGEMKPSIVLDLDSEKRHDVACLLHAAGELLGRAIRMDVN